MLPLFFFFFNRSDNFLTCLKTCIWNPGAYRYKIVRLSSAQFVLVMKKKKHTQWVQKIKTDVKNKQKLGRAKPKKKDILMKFF